MASKRRSRPARPVPDPIIEHAQSLVMLWDRAEDWAIPRIPPAQVRVLTVLDRSGPMNLTALAGRLGAIPSSASRLCDRLVAAGLLDREISAVNRREVMLSVSGEGRHRLEAFASDRRRDFARVLELMSPEARASLLEGLRQFGDAADEVLESTALEA